MPEKAKKKRSAGLKYVKRYKSITVERAGMIIFLDECPMFIFFSPSYSKKNIVWGVEVAPAYQVIKKLNIDHLPLYLLYPTPCRNGYRISYKKNNGDMPVTELLNTCTR